MCIDTFSYLLGKKKGGGGSNEYFKKSNQVDGLNLSSFIKEIPYEYIDFTGITYGNSFFEGCKNLKKITVRNCGSFRLGQVDKMFGGCTSLEFLDIRDLLLDYLSTISVFGNNTTGRVPNNCLIIVKSQTEKSWISMNLPRYTNVKTVEEYEASL